MSPPVQIPIPRYELLPPLKTLPSIIIFCANLKHLLYLIKPCTNEKTSVSD